MLFRSMSRTHASSASTTREDRENQLRMNTYFLLGNETHRGIRVRELQRVCHIDAIDKSRIAGVLPDRARDGERSPNKNERQPLWIDERVGVDQIDAARIGS